MGQPPCFGRVTVVYRAEMGGRIDSPMASNTPSELFGDRGEGCVDPGGSQGSSGGCGGEVGLAGVQAGGGGACGEAGHPPRGPPPSQTR